MKRKGATGMEQETCREIGTAEALAVLRTLEDAEILIHRSPDGDCIGCGYALHHLLKGLGVRSRVVCADPIPAMYDCITAGITFADFPAKTYISADVADRKLFGDLPQKDAEIALCIDHHVSNTHYAKLLHWDSGASAACEVLYALMRAHDLPLTREIALCLYIGMATDTGCFQFSNAGAGTFAAVAEIKRLYPDLPYARLNREFFVLKTQGRIALDAALMQSIRFASEGRIALIYASAELLNRLQVTDEDTDGMANLPMQVRGVEIGITVKQKDDGSYRISLRAGDRADVSVIADRYGGGGHVKAAGCTVSGGDPEDVCGMLMDTAAAALQDQMTERA